jgi:hypothetical protein
VDEGEGVGLMKGDSLSAGLLTNSCVGKVLPFVS